MCLPPYRLGNAPYYLKKSMFLTKDKFGTNCRAIKKELLEFAYYSNDICPDEDKATYKTLLDNMLEFLNRY